MHTPDPNTHFKISIVKSGLRILAGVLLINQYFVGAGSLLIVAELLGIAEEIF